MTVTNDTQAPAPHAPASAAPPETTVSDVQGGEPPTATGGPEHPAATEPADQDDDQGDEHDDGDQDDDTEHGGRRNREAGLRRRAQAAEAERDTLRAQLDTLHRQLVGGIAKAHGLPEVELLESAGHELASFLTDDGRVKIAEVIEATTATMARYSITAKRPPRPNEQQGAYGTTSSGGGLAETLNKALGR